jgi:hypothetical protein
VARPGVSPEVGGAAGPGEDAAHAATGRVVGAGPRREIGNDFTYVGGAVCEGLQEHAPIVEFGVYLGPEPDAVARSFEGRVEAGEKA